MFKPKIEGYVVTMSQGAVAEAVIAPQLRARKTHAAEIDCIKSAQHNPGQMTSRAAASEYDREDAVERIRDSSSMILHSIAVAQEARRKVSEQELLLRELDHRFKNMLAMIAGFIRYQLRGVDDPDARIAMEVTGGRVQAMGVVHQICSHAPTGDLAEIVTSVCTNLIKADPRFELKLETEQVIVPVQKATVVALISNELVTNAMKYALRDRKVGRIAVSLRPGDGNSVVLSVSDDGAPSAADVQPHVNGTGLDLIARLAKQLAGELRVESAPKRYSVVFPSHFAVCG